MRLVINVKSNEGKKKTTPRQSVTVKHPDLLTETNLSTDFARGVLSWGQAYVSVCSLFYFHLLLVYGATTGTKETEKSHISLFFCV